MPIAFQLGNSFWIETFDRPRISHTANQEIDTTFVLQRAGTFVSGSTHVNADVATGSSDDMHSFLLTTALGMLNYGDKISSIILRTQNSAGAGRNFGVNAFILMRGSGR